MVVRMLDVIPSAPGCRRTARRPFSAAFLLMASLGPLATAATAQEPTREGVIAAQVADKQKSLQPVVRSRIEKIMYFVEDRRILERLAAERDGLYPRFGGLVTGSGVAVGPGYRRHFGGDGVWDLSAAMSLKAYKVVEGRVRLPSFGRDMFTADAVARYLDYPQQRFYGLGLNTLKADKTSFGISQVNTSAGLTFQPARAFNAGARIGFLAPDVGRGRLRRFPSIEQRFADASAPGLDRQPDFVFGEVSAGVDYTDFPLNPRTGGRHRVAFTKYDDRNLNRYSFRRVDAEAMQLLPFFDKRRIIALYARVALSDTDRGHEVPFYLMPTMGGSHLLRGFEPDRFRDRNLLTLSAEYRWEVFAALDMALFYDRGSVAPRRQGLRLGDMKESYGIGFRFSTRRRLIMRFDIAGGGGEGIRYYLKFGPSF